MERLVRPAPVESGGHPESQDLRALKGLRGRRANPALLVFRAPRVTAGSRERRELRDIRV